MDGKCNNWRLSKIHSKYVSIRKINFKNVMTVEGLNKGNTAIAFYKDIGEFNLWVFQ
jgi:hypothetical protein